MRSRIDGAIIAQRNSTDLKPLKKLFLDGLKNRERGDAQLRDTVLELTDAGVMPSQMVEWGTAKGYQEDWIRRVISSVLIQKGHRRRKPGAGRKPSPEAVSEATRAIHKWHEKAPVILLGAYRCARKMLRERKPELAEAA